VRRLRPDRPVPHSGCLLHARASGGHRRVRRADRAARERDECRTALEARMSNTGSGEWGVVRDAAQRSSTVAHIVPLPTPPSLIVIALLALLPGSASSQARPTYQQEMQDNQRRLEGIRRERSEVEQELARLRTAAHSLSDEIANIERQKLSTNRIVNELDRQIAGLGGQIDQITVDLLLAQDALLEKRAVLERRLVDIHKRGPLYVWQVLLAAESFGDLLSRYKYLYLVSRQDRLLTNDMHKLRDRVARQRQLLVDARETLGRRRRERGDELDRYLALERARQTNLRETRRSAREAEQRLSRLERDERSLNDRIEALERARREAEARGVAGGPGAVTTADP